MEVFDDWLARLAAPGPDPGGGAAAAVMLGLGSALIEMVASYPPRNPGPGVDLAAVAAAAAALRRRSLGLVASDAAASARLVAAWGTADDDPPELAQATVAAARCGAAALSVANAAAPLLEVLVVHGDTRVRGDVGVAALALGAALRASVLTMAGNLEAAAAAGVPAADVEDLRRVLLRTDDLLVRLEEVASSIG